MNIKYVAMVEPKNKTKKAWKWESIGMTANLNEVHKLIADRGNKASYDFWPGEVINEVEV